ncbi:MAG: hypothetical protein ACRYF0_19780 [Janthinobacterium lividum]
MSLSTPEAEAGRAHLVRALGELPTAEPAATAWAAIASHLAADQAISNALPQLPTHEPADDTWLHVAARLDRLAPPVARPQPQRRPQRWRQLSLAASLLVLLAAGLAWFGRPASAPVARLPAPSIAAPVAAVPALPALPPAPSAEPLDTEGEAFIDAHCSSLPQVCQSGEFQQLRAQLTDLQQQEQQLRTQTQRGATPQLEQQQVQVTIRKATVTRELIHLLIT